MRKAFKTGNDFDAFYAAEKWLKQNGYSIGSMECDRPIGIVKGDCYIPKWRYVDDRAALDGVIATGGKRNCDITVIIFDDADPRGIYQ
jgi:hypothetical protein